MLEEMLMLIAILIQPNLEIIASDTDTNNVSDSDRDAGAGDVVASSASNSR